MRTPRRIMVALGTVLAAMGGQLAIPTASEAMDMPTFAEIDVTTGILYRDQTADPRQPATLALDFHEGRNDTRPKRPLVIWIHGGSFSAGSRNDPFEMAAVQGIVKLGFTLASIDYRLGSLTASGGMSFLLAHPELLTTILNATEDSREAVRFMRDRAEQYRIDPDLIFVAGVSAGAILALNVGYLRDNTDGVVGGPEDPYRVAGVVSVAGETFPDVVQAGEPPLFMAHLRGDPVVPYAEAVAVCDAATSVGVPCQFESYEGADHMFGLLAVAGDILAASTAWSTAIIADPPGLPRAVGSRRVVPAAVAVTVTPAFTG